MQMMQFAKELECQRMQMLVDMQVQLEKVKYCDNSYNEGCNGSLMDYAFEFIINSGGIDSEDDYPYKATDGRCDNFRKNAKVVTIDGYEDVPVNDEKSLQKAVASQPVSVAIEAGGRVFQLYQSVRKKAKNNRLGCSY